MSGSPGNHDVRMEREEQVGSLFLFGGGRIRVKARVEAVSRARWAVSPKRRWDGERRRESGGFCQLYWAAGYMKVSVSSKGM